MKSGIRGCLMVLVLIFSQLGIAQAHSQFSKSQNELKKAYEIAKKRHLDQAQKLGKIKALRPDAKKSGDQSIGIESKITKTQKAIAFSYTKKLTDLKNELSKLITQGRVLVTKTATYLFKGKPRQSNMTNLPPVAGGVSHFVISSGTRPEFIFLTQDPMTDPDNALEKVVWDFGDGSSMEIPVEELDPHALVNHFFPGVGTYTVKVRVYDELLDYTEYTDTITVVDNQLPRPNLTYSPGSGNEVVFEGFANDPENDVAQYAWDFGDGNYDSGPTLTNPTHTYANPGTYQVGLLVIDGKNAQNSIVKTVYVSQSMPSGAAPPSIVLDSTNKIGEAPHSITFDASASVDEQSTPVTRFFWDFGDFYSRSNYSTSATPNHVYKIPGTYFGRVQIWDEHDNTTEMYFAVFVAGEDPIAPMIHGIQWQNNREVSFDSSTFSLLSTAGYGSYRWDFGDGIGTIGTYAVHEYAADGTYTVTLTVHDAQGVRHVVQKNITISTVNDSPTVALDIEDNYLVTDQSYNYDASASVDSQQSDPLNFTWNIADGTIINGSGFDEINHTFTERGYLPIRLIVTNSRGLSQEAYQWAQVQEGSLLLSKIVYSPKIGIAPFTTTFQSYRSWGSNSTVIKRTWALDGIGSDEENFIRTFTDPGEYWVSLLVEDNLGNEAISWETVTVLDGSSIPSGNLNPIADFNVYFTHEVEPQQFTLDGNASSDPDGSVRYWEWVVDGNVMEEGSKVYNYFQPGYHTVQLKVFDDWGASHTVSKTFKTSASFDSILGFDNSPVRPVKGHPVYFTAEDTVVPGADLESYQWDFGDGSPVKYGEKVNHTYSTEGTYTVTLTVHDYNGAPQTETKSIDVEVPANPVAKILVSDLERAMKVRSGEIYYALRFPETFRFSTPESESQMPIIDANWDFGDGNTGFGTDIEYVYHKPGTYNVQVSVIDALGNSGTSASTIVIPESETCPDQDGMTVCLRLDNSIGNVLPFSEPNWIISHSLGAVDISDDPDHLPESWIKLIEHEADEDAVEVDLSDIATIVGDKVHISRQGLQSKSIDLTKAYRLEMRALSTTGDDLIGAWPKLLFGKGALSLSTLESNIRFVVSSGASGYVRFIKMGNSRNKTLVDLPEGHYTIQAFRGTTMDLLSLKVKGNTHLQIDMSDTAIAKRKEKRIEKADKGRSSGTHMANTISQATKAMGIGHSSSGDHYGWALGYCGQYPPFKQAPPYQIEPPENHTPMWYFDSANPMARSEFTPIPSLMPKPVKLKCRTLDPTVYYGFEYWQGHSYRQCLPAEPEYEASFRAYLRNRAAKFENRPIHIRYEVRDGISKKVVLSKAITTSSKQLRQQYGMTLQNVTHRLGMNKLVDQDGDITYNLDEIIDIPSNTQKPEIRFELDAPNDYSEAPPYATTECHLYELDEEEMFITAITAKPEASLSTKTLSSTGKNGYQALTRTYGIFPVHVDPDTTNGPLAADPDAFKASFIVEIDQRSHIGLSWEGVTVTFEYGTQTFTKDYDFIGPSFYDAKTNLYSDHIIVDVQDISPMFVWEPGKDEIALSFEAFDSFGTRATVMTKKFLAVFNAKMTGISELVCKDGWYSTKISAFGQDLLLSRMKELSAGTDGLKFRCNDISTPFGGNFDYSTHSLGWTHKGHLRGLNADVRYFNFEGTSTEPSRPNYKDFYDYEKRTGSPTYIQQRRRDLNKYMAFSAKAKLVADSAVSDDLYVYKERVKEFCDTLTGSDIPCSSSTQIEDITHETVLKVCQWYEAPQVGSPAQDVCPPVVDGPTPEYIDLAAIKRFSLWVKYNHEAFTKFKDFGDIKMIISQGESQDVILEAPFSIANTFSNWQHLALRNGLWPDGNVIWKVSEVSNNFEKQRIDEVCYSPATSSGVSLGLGCFSAPLIGDKPASDHYNHIHFTIGE